LALEASEAVAARYVTALKDRFTEVLQFPLAGAPRGRLARGLRVRFHEAYAVYYRVERKAVVIVRVIHGARDATALAERGGFS
jgi:toxin ParE1/3/4